MAKTLDEAGVKRLIQEIKGANKNLNTPISISTENTAESMAQNVKNIADYVKKAKAAGIADVNGMAVTCLIDGENSGGGYLYGTNTQVLICGILPYEDSSVSCITVIDGTYGEQPIAVQGHIGQVTSDMLVEGARNPIILTPETTEIDEETYQKLSQEGTDVILSLGDGNFVELQGIFNTGDLLALIFGYSQFDESNEGIIVTFVIAINTSAPHTLTAVPGSCDPVSKNTLSSVLQEIDLTGTNADRKAKLDQFETDWKALTGADDLTGARFVGYVPTDVDSGNPGSVLLNYNSIDGTYSGILMSDGAETAPKKIEVRNSDGSLTITPLFSHLEAITIYTDNTLEHKQANLDNIAAYEANLQALGVTNVDGIMIPIKFEDDPENIATTFSFSGYITKYSSSFYDGIVSTLNGSYKPRVIIINGQQGEDGGKVVFETIALEKQLDNYTPKALNAKSLEAITIKTDKSTASKAANVAAIKTYVDNLEALGVDTTKGYMIPIRTSSEENTVGFIIPNMTGTGYVGLGEFGNGNGINLYISNEGHFSKYRLQEKSDNDLTTNSNSIVGAINEVNALAKGNAKSLEAITIKSNNATESKAANVAAIKAYVDNLTALGIDTTKGFLIPINVEGQGSGFISRLSGTDSYMGIMTGYGIPTFGIAISVIGEYYSYRFQTDSDNSLTTESKQIVGAINEVNAIAKGYSTIFTPIELTTETAQNKTAIDARVAAFTAQGISLTNGCCIPVTYKGVYAGNISLINGDWYGLLVKNTNNPADNINIKLSADGTITEGNSAQ